MIDKEILNILKSLKKKYYKNKIIKYISRGLFAYSIGLIIIISISKIIPITYITSKAIWLIAAIASLTMIFIIYKKPNDIEFAKVIDSKGLKERVSTSLELMDSDDKFSMIQKKDTLEKLKDNSLREKIKTTYPKRVFISTIIILSISAIMLNIDTHSVDVAKAIEADTQTIEEEKEKIDQAIEEVKKDKDLTEDEKREIEESFKNLKNSLEESKDLKDSEKDIIKSKEELEEIKKQLNEKQIDNLSKQLSQNELTQSLGEEISDRNSENISKEMKNISQELKNMDDESKKNAIENLKNLEKSLDNENIKAVLDQLANNLDDDEKIEKNMDNLSEEINNVINKENTSSQSLEDAIETLENMSEKAGENYNSTSGNGNKNSLGSGAGAGSGEGAGQGGGVGSGSTDDLDSDKVNESSGEGASKGESSGGEVKDYEKIYTPTNRERESYDAEISGINSNGDNDGAIKTKKFGDTAGESIPYNEVLKSYKNTAYERLESGEIPTHMKDIIKKYFTQLE